MFFANISIAEKYNYLEEKFTRAYKWLAETDIKSLPEGSYPIWGDKVIANVQEYTTKLPSEGLFETHKKFFDIQYLVEGVELLGACTRQGLVVKTPYDTANDVTFYEDPDYAGQVLLRGDDYVIFAPEDAHKPRCQAGAPLPVKKIVVKVPV